LLTKGEDGRKEIAKEVSSRDIDYRRKERENDK
jgi:hypothetical protein